MTPSIFSSLSHDVKKKLREIVVVALLTALRWLIERLASGGSNPGTDADSTK